MSQSKGYIRVWAPGHPVAWKNGWAPEHRKVWFDTYGEIPKGHLIHHRNGNRSDNRLENLDCLTKRQHSQEHFNEKAADRLRRIPRPKGRPAWNRGTGQTTLTCSWCRKEFQRSGGEYRKNLKRGEKTLCSRRCHASYLNTLHHKKARALGEGDD